jgi:type I restriction enzyme R subunit
MKLSRIKIPVIRLAYDCYGIGNAIKKAIERLEAVGKRRRESVQAEIRLKVKKILRKYGYPPDKQEKATQTVLEQAEMIARDWVAA